MFQRSKELRKCFLSFLRDRTDPLSRADAMDLKEEPDEFIGINKGKYSQEGKMQDHAADPGSRHRQCKQTDDLQDGAESRLASGSETGIDDVVAGSHCAHAQIDEQHIFSVIDSLLSQAKQ